MTWKQLVGEVSKLSPEQQNTDVTVFVRGVDEFYPVSDRVFTTPPPPAESCILDANHPYLQV